jgi:hypothetical protein
VGPSAPSEPTETTTAAAPPPSSAPPATAAQAPKHPSSAPTHRSAPRAGCTPPYEVTPDGVRKYKPQCLQ